MKKWMTITLFTTKIKISLYYFLNGQKFCKSRSEGDEVPGRRLANDCYSDPFITYVVIPHSGPYVLANMTRSSQLRYTRAARPHHRWHYMTLHECMTLWLTVLREYPSIYNFTTPLRPCWDSRDLLPLGNQHELFSHW